MKMIKKLLSLLPDRVQELMRVVKYDVELFTGCFESTEPEFRALESWLKKGDYAIDVGANVGHYTVRMSQIVGETGRVLAFEPMLKTFQMLENNCKDLKNVELINAGASDEYHSAYMSVTKFDTGLQNFYEAKIAFDGDFPIECVPIDSYSFPKLDLVKIDVEGWEVNVLIGMMETLKKHHPILIVEDGVSSKGVESILVPLGYVGHKIDKKSPNKIYTWSHR